MAPIPTRFLLVLMVVIRFQAEQASAFVLSPDKILLAEGNSTLYRVSFTFSYDAVVGAYLQYVSGLPDSQTPAPPPTVSTENGNETEFYVLYPPFNVRMENFTVENVTMVPNATINEKAGSGTLTFKSSTFMGFAYGRHNITLRLTVDEGFWNDTANTYIRYEKPGCRLSPSTSYTKTRIFDETVVVPVSSCSNIAVTWSLANNVKLQQYYAGLPTDVSFQVGIGLNALETVSLVATNEVFTVNTSFQLDIQNGLNGLDFKFMPPDPEPDIDMTFYLSLARDAETPMGTVTIVMDLGDGAKQSLTIDIDKKMEGGHMLMIKTRQYKEQSVFYANCTVTGKYNNLNLAVVVPVWENSGTWLTTAHGSVGIEYVVDGPVNFTFVNRPKFAFNYRLNYGDGSAEEIDSPTFWNESASQRLPTYFNHTYRNTWRYTLNFTWWNPGHHQETMLDVFVEYRVPQLTLGPAREMVDVNQNFNFTIVLAERRPTPTNASCYFVLDSGKDRFSIQTNLSIAYGETLFVPYSIRPVGDYQVTVNCSNHVNSVTRSALILVRDISVDDFVPIYRTPFPMNSTSDPVTVEFRLQVLELRLVPDNLALEWDWGDNGSTPLHLTSTWLEWHAYSKRGDYRPEVTVHYKGRSRTISMPLRMGAVQISATPPTADIATEDVSFTFLRIPHPGTKFRIEYGNGFDQTITSDTHTYRYPDNGIFTPRFVAYNDTFHEFVDLSHTLTIDNPMDNLKLDVVSMIPYPSGYFTFKVMLDAGEPRLPDLVCYMMFGDRIDKRTYNHTMDCNPGHPFVYTFKYKSLGKHVIQAMCKNLLYSKNFTKHVEVENNCFSKTGIFDPTYGLPENPMKMYRSMTVELSSRIVIYCFTLEPFFKWTFAPIGGSSDQSNIPDSSNVDRFIVTKGSIELGLYNLTLFIGFKQDVYNYFEESTFLLVEDPPIIAEILGGTKRDIQAGNPLEVDAKTMSYDPLLSQSDRDPYLLYEWRCYSGTEEQPLTLLDCSQLTLDSGAEGVLRFKPSVILSGVIFNVTVFVGKVQRVKGNFTQVIHVKAATPTLSIRCRINCEKKTAVSSDLAIAVECLNCVSDAWLAAEFTWTVLVQNGSSFVEADGFRDNLLNTGEFRSGLVLKRNFLKPGFAYQIHVSANVSNMEDQGEATLTVHTNMPPYDGSCVVTPTSGRVSETEFSVNCKDWKDEGFRAERNPALDTSEALNFKFILKRGPIQVPLHEGLERSSPNLTLPLIQSTASEDEEEEQYQILVRIFDVLQDFVEVPLNITLTSPVSDEEMSQEEALNSTQRLLEDSKEAITGEAVYGNVKKLMRTLSSVASVLGNINVPADNFLIEDPEKARFQTLAALTEDLSRQRNSSLQEAIANQTEEFMGMLANRSSEIQQLNGQGLASFGENIATLMLRPEYTKLETVERCKDVATEGAGRLANLVKVTPFPIGERVEEAASGLVAGLERMLAATVPDVTTSDVANTIAGVAIEPEDDSAGNVTKLTYNDIRDLIDQRNEAKQAVKNSKNEATKNTMPSVESALNKLHDSLLAMVITGQEGNDVKRGNLALKAVKGLPGDFASKAIAAQSFKVDLSSLNSSSTNKSQSFDVKTTVFDKNPYTWSETAAEISTPVLKLDITADNGTKVDTPVTVKLQRKAANFTRYNRIDMAMGTDPTMVYHVIVLRHEQEVVQLFMRVPKLLTSLTVYMQNDRGPTKKDFAVKETMDPEVFQDKLEFSVFVDTAGKLKKGLVYIGLQMLSGGELPANISSINETLDVNITDLAVNLTDVVTLDPPLGRRRRSVSSILCSTNASDANCTDTTTATPSVYLNKDGEEVDPDDVYEFKVVTDSCQVWVPESESWEATACTVSPFSSEEETICDCPSPPGNTFASSFFVAPNTIDFSIVFSKFDITNASVYGTMIAILVLYFLIMLYARRQDSKDRARWRVGFLKDNSAQDQYFYLLKVYTGLRKNSGTKSNIGFVLGGDLADTGVRILSDGERTPETGSVLNLVMAVEQNLGDLTYLRIWHDNSGYAHEAAWFLSKVVVEDLQQHKRYMFNCDQWLALDKEDGLVDRLLPVCTKDDFASFNALFSQHAQLNMTDTHLWVSVFVRPDRSTFSRCQRITCCLTLLFLTMIANAMFFRSAEEKQTVDVSTTFSIGVFHLSMRSIFISVVSILITLPPSLLMVYLFKMSRPIPPRYRMSTLLRRCCRRQVKEVTDPKPVSFLDEVMDKQEQKNPLPWGCIYAGWVLAAVAVSVSAFFLLLYSMMWGKLKSEEWVTAFFLSFIESIFVLDPIKVIILAVLLALLVRRSPYDRGNDLDVTDVAKEAGKFSKDGTHFDVTMLPPEPVPESLLQSARKRKQQELRAQSVFWEIVIYMIFLVVLFIIAFGNRDEYFFRIKDGLTKTLYSDDKKGFQKIKTSGDLFTWAKGSLLDSLYPLKDYRNKNLKYREKLFYSDYVSFRVGPPSLRQLRMPKAPLPAVHYMYPALTENQTFFGAYEEAKQETRDFCLGWMEPPCPPGEDKKSYTSSAWTYTSPHALWTFPFLTDIGAYGGGGYLADLSIKKDKALQRLTELEKQGWLDRRTRLVMVEFTLFNPNNRVFVNVRLGAEHTETGSVYTFCAIQPFQVYGHSGAKGAFLVLAEIVALLVFVWLMVRTAIAMVKQRLAFFHQFWLVLDLVISVFALTCVAFLVVREVFSQRLMANFTSEPKVFVSFQALIFWDQCFVVMLGFLIFAAIIRALRILGYNQRVTILASVLRNSARPLSGFFIVFAMVFLAFGLAGYVLLKQEEDYRSVTNALLTMFIYMLLRDPLGEILMTSRALEKIFMLALVFFILFVLFTMFQAILNNSMTVIRLDLAQVPPPYGLVDVLLNMYRSVIGDWLPTSLFHKTKTLPGSTKLSLVSSGDTYRVLSGLRKHMNKALEDETVKTLQKLRASWDEGKDNPGFHDDEGRCSAVSTKNIKLTGPAPFRAPKSLSSDFLSPPS